MAWRVDPYDNSVVIDGWENGIADSPYSGIANLQNVNVVTIPGECSVGFSGTAVMAATIGTVAVTGTGSGTILVSTAGNSTANFENGVALQFTSFSGSGATINVGGTNAAYWMNTITGTPPSSFAISADFTQGTNVAITEASASGVISFYSMTEPKYFAQSYLTSRFTSPPQKYFMVDSSGQVWTDRRTTTSGLWEFMGNSVDSSSSGNGIQYYVAQDANSSQTGYLFVFRNSQIDYVKDDGSSSWQYAWKPGTGVGGGGQGAYLKNPVGANNSHESMVTPDNRVCYCDGSYIGRFYQATMGTKFDPLVSSSYVFDNTSLLPATDVAQCMTFLGANLLVGGRYNRIYPWNMFDTTYSTPLILVPENSIAKMVTVNNKTFIFAGTRGRIYITNGSQVELYKKVPDQISGTIEPFFFWGGATFNKNNLYFSCYATTNSLTTNASFGGVWAINIDNKAIRLVQQLSYGTYDGFASALIAKTDVASSLQGIAGGVGLLSGWISSISNGLKGTVGGLDLSISTPYTNSKALVETDIIPIGSFDKPRDFTRIEYKLAVPMVNGESIQLQARTDQSLAYTTIFTDTATSTYLPFSKSSAVNFKNLQWIQLRAILNSVANSPSYVRLKEIRLAGLVGQNG